MTKSRIEIIDLIDSEGVVKVRKIVDGKEYPGVRLSGLNDAWAIAKEYAEDTLLPVYLVNV